jgi:tartrate dehydrogenase/decarboxylase/D-malate dehydrogenase
VNLRPARLLRGVNSPLAAPGELDITVVRESTEDEYSDSGGRVYRGTPHEIAVHESIFTRRGVERIIRYAFEEAKTRRRLLVRATKFNGISITMPFFDEIFREICEEYPDIEASLMHADALAARLVLIPERFDVVVGSNLFGDLLSEVTAGIEGAIWAAALMLEHVGDPETRSRILSALEDALASGTKTRDLGGSATTEEKTNSVIGRLSGPG